MLGLRGQPLLDRLLFEAAFDSRDARRVTSTLLLMASPFRGPLAMRARGGRRSHDDPAVRRAAAALFLLLGHEESRDPAVDLLDSEDASSSPRGSSRWRTRGHRWTASASSSLLALPGDP